MQQSSTRRCNGQFRPGLRATGCGRSPLPATAFVRQDTEGAAATAGAARAHLPDPTDLATPHIVGPPVQEPGAAVMRRPGSMQKMLGVRLRRGHLNLGKRPFAACEAGFLPGHGQQPRQPIDRRRTGRNHQGVIGK